jgi:hypothetical protein
MTRLISVGEPAGPNLCALSGAGFPAGDAGSANDEGAVVRCAAEKFATEAGAGFSQRL